MTSERRRDSIIQLISPKFCFIYLFNNSSKIWRNPSSTRALSLLPSFVVLGSIKEVRGLPRFPKHEDLWTFMLVSFR